MALKVKSRAPKMPAPRSIPVATRQARQIVDRIIPGVGATVESRSTATADLDPIMVTTITIPAETTRTNRLELLAGLTALGAEVAIHESSRIVITRKR